MKKDKDIERLVAERDEINSLQRGGFTFSVTGRWLFGLKHTWMYTITEPCGGCLIAQAREWVEIDIDSRLIDADDRIAECNALIAKHALRCYRVLALAICNEDCRNSRRVERITRRLLVTLTPSDVRRLLCSVMALGDLRSFISAIALISKARLTMPDAIADTTKAWSAHSGR